MSKWPCPERLKRIDALAALGLGGLGLLEDDPDRVRGLGRRDDALGPAERHRRARRRRSCDRAALDQALLDQRTESGGIAVVAQAAGVEGRRDEVVSQRVHRHQRRHPDGVAEVVGEPPAGQRRARGRLGRKEARVQALAQAAAHQRIGDPGEVGAAADATDDDVGVLAGCGSI